MTAGVLAWLSYILTSLPSGNKEQGSKKGGNAPKPRHSGAGRNPVILDKSFSHSGNDIRGDHSARFNQTRLKPVSHPEAECARHGIAANGQIAAKHRCV